MKRSIILFITSISIMLTFSECNRRLALKEAYRNKFMIGVALSDDLVNTQDERIHNLISQQFNTLVPENCMKSEVLQPQEGVFDFSQADRIVALGEANNMFIVGHALIWHSQAPDWIFADSEGNDVSREVLIERMKNHIYTVVGRYKGRVQAWDVVNEAIDDQSGLRNTKWRQIIGDDYIELAFRFAHEADPDAELYYNDYNMYFDHKRAEAISLITRLQKKNIPIHAIGMQGHIDLDTPIGKIEQSIEEYSRLGIKVMITELDISVLPFPLKSLTADVSTDAEYQMKYNLYADGLPQSVAEQQSEVYRQLFKVFLNHKDVISRVTFWGLNDGVSWKNNWPMKGRTDYPLLFDRNYQPKIAYNAVIEIAK